MNFNLIDIMCGAIATQKIKQDRINPWKDSVFEDIDTLKNDFSGKVGEQLIAEICKIAGLDSSYTEDSTNQDDGTYDIIINGKRLEIKTARMSSDGKRNFQHESLRDYGSDYFIFVDIEPDKYYLTIIPSNFDFKSQHPILGRKPHLRKESTNVYKFDFGSSTIKKGLENGVTIEINSNTRSEDVVSFMQRIIV